MANPGYDYATTPVYTLHVTVTDFTFNVTSIVTVNVLPLPVFDNLPTAPVTLAETAPGGLVVYDVRARDPAGGAVMYELAAASVPFEIDSASKWRAVHELNNSDVRGPSY